MTATDLGLNGPVKFLGCFLKNVSCSLGLAQSPSTCSVVLVEDPCASPPAIFNPPVLGRFVRLNVGTKFEFAGVVTKYEKDISNTGGRFIKVDISDVREIMKNCPIILAPGYRTVATHIKNNTECSVVDVYGAFDTAEFGFNVSGWNQSGITYDNVKKALEGGAVVIGQFPKIEIPAQGVKAFRERYRFNLSEVTPLVNPSYRINSNLISIGDLIQELATLNQFAWYTETNGNSGENIEIKIKTISRKQDNVDIDLDGFLQTNKDKVITASSGLELRNEIACSVLLGAPVEQMRVLNILGMANTPVDISQLGGYEQYYMSELEMRVVLGTKASWESYVKLTDKDYGVSLLFEPIPKIPIPDEVSSQIGKQAVKRRAARNKVIKGRNEEERKENEDKVGKLYEMLKGHAESNYGKRFMFQQAIDVDYVDAAWTVDAIAGNNNPNEYFRNDDGKTRCYVQFTAQNQAVGTSVAASSNLGFGIGGGFAVGRPGDVEPLQLGLNAVKRNKIDFITEADKTNYVFDSIGNLYVAATIEDNTNVIRLNMGVFLGSQKANELSDLANLKKEGAILEDKLEDAAEAQAAAAAFDELDADGNTINLKSREERRLSQIYGARKAYEKLHLAAFQPYKVHVPARSKFVRYGPVYATNIGPDSQGQLEIDQDDGFSPWEFGSSQLMLDAMQFKVDNQSSNVKDVESANITVENFPQFSLGESLGRNSNITSISISFGGQVTTTYQLQSFLRKFGELTKGELATLSLFARRGGRRNIPQDTVAFIDKYRTKINAQFSGRGTRLTADGAGGAFSFE